MNAPLLHRRLARIAVVSAAIVTLAAPTAALAQDDNGGGHDPVTLCHATGNGSYVVITVDSNAAENGHSNHGDVLPGPDGSCPGSTAASASFAPFIAQDLPTAGRRVDVLAALALALAAGGGVLVRVSRRPLAV